VRQPGILPLQSLDSFVRARLTGLISGIHLLPFYPASSDDGFSVIDYRQVDPALGSWEDVVRLGERFRLMFDAVINHVSAQSAWFRGYLAGDPKYQDYFITVHDDPDLSTVVRPRALPLLTEFETHIGRRKVWTTFSADQIDLNYHNPEVLMEVLDLLLYYIRQGAQLIRLDAIAYLWKEIGTTCIHLPQTHAVVQLFRSVLDQLAPGAMLVTETNVPHEENISYFGDGYNEAHMVYNFALPPLILHTFYHGDCSQLAEWAENLRLPSRQTTFFNFLASHDGIGLSPARGILTDAAVDVLVQRAIAHGGLVSYKSMPDGSQLPYELNINYFDALCNPQANEPLELQVKRFLCAQAIMMAMIGVPGIYFHSLFGSRGWPDGVRLTGRNRTINRQKLERSELEMQLDQPGSMRWVIFNGFRRLLSARKATPAFDPFGDQRVLECGAGVFGLLRQDLRLASQTKVICLHNVTPLPQSVGWESFQPGLADFDQDSSFQVRELISEQEFTIGRNKLLKLDPYQTAWMAVKVQNP
jgi:sucrose phosphorylase